MDAGNKLISWAGVSGPSEQALYMRVLTVYASAHGSTAEVARFIADIWQGRGVDTDVVPVGSVTSPAGYDAYALGSPIHSGLWLPEMAAFVRRSRELLARKPLYLWLNCLRVLEPEGYAYVTNNYLPNILDRRLSFRKIGLFAGKIDLATINRDEVWTLTFRYDGRENLTRLAGDYRNWEHIRDWAEQVAVDLEATMSRR
jgi:menaquinone-dependent protoporphyrinogen oxidase